MLPGCIKTEGRSGGASGRRRKMKKGWYKRGRERDLENTR
jgi:hypothetical protein